MVSGRPHTLPLRHRSVRPALLAALLAAPACGGGGGEPGPEPAPATPQRPPQGQAALEAWLGEGHYRSWACEAQISNPLPDHLMAGDKHAPEIELRAIQFDLLLGRLPE